jgi:SagB-type dehydrogenase family enzyme
VRGRAAIAGLLLVGAIVMSLPSREQSGISEGAGKAVKFAAPVAGKVSLDDALARRRSARSFRSEALSLDNLARMLWAAQGVTNPRGLRTAPSAGAKYPLEIYVVAGAVKGLGGGLYRYRPGNHDLVLLEKGDHRASLCDAALRQSWVKEGAAVIVITGMYSRTTGKYGERGIRYVHMEAGCALQNILLEASALGLGACPVGAFDDEAVRKALDLPQGETPLMIVPIGQA